MDIQPIAAKDRNLGSVDYFLLWAGVAISLAEIWAGGFLAPMGLGMGIWAILLGHLIGNTLMGLGGMIGSTHGIPSMVSIRPAFGLRGADIAAVLNIIQLIGWAAIMLIIGGQAGAMLGAQAGGLLADSRFWVVTIGMGTLLWALCTGRPLWKVLQNTSVVALLFIVVLMTWVSMRELGQSALPPKGSGIPFMIGLDLVIAMPISWLPLVADYSRFSRRTGPAFWSTWWGYFIVSSWMYVIGLSATLVTGDTDPAMLLLTMMGKIGLAVPALILVIFSTITSDFPDIYSATCSMLNISRRLKARTLMWIAGLLSIALALVFPPEQYENFLLFIGAMFIPLFGVVLTDYFILRKQRIDLREIYRVGGAYWYWNGFNVAAVAAWAVGFGVFELIAVMKYPVGGSLPGMAAAGGLYWILTRVQARKTP
ncbi:putative hydroxymethylpyrimidine transporter CytX [Desulfococcus sp.]|uniref:putative hydroxymethylpyrimidine transporter CytX n=1 Tax=Desulfococcus sp. TaxID=2025834 RepID=UPI0035948A95